MHIIQRISVKPVLPDALNRLDELAFNLYWSWLPGAFELFERLDPAIWSATNHNPVLLLAEANQARLNEAAHSEAFLAQYRAVMDAFDRYLNDAAGTWFQRHHPERQSQVIAYFSAEFGLHESLPIYSGGLGILSGDHCKEASDLGLPLVGVGFLYPQGYFHQQLDESGWQEARYDHLPFESLPVTPVYGPDGQPLQVAVELPERRVYLRVWQIRVGRCTVYLMDTDVERNAPADRQLSHRLYYGDEEMRVAWELVFGLGGVRVLRALGLEPAVWHMNEGHSAFMGLERVRELVHHHGLTFAEAVEAVKANTVFTTHTPVPAGNDTFAYELVEKYFGAFWAQLGISREEFLDFARQDIDWGTRYSMTVLALRLSGHANGVSRLHGHVSREMWQFVWPGTPRDEIPIRGITNGVHAATWIAPRLQTLYRHHLGPDFQERIHLPATWQGLDAVPDAELWAAHLDCKRDLAAYAGRKTAALYERWGESPEDIARAASLLDPNALVIGFARRFATYKRATLILKHADRLRRLVNDPARPVQFVFAGKAHPADDAGKHLIQHLFQMARDEHSGFKDKFVFLEDYDIRMGRRLVAGVDVWLNTPRRPHEASGTSGEKAAMCGVPHFSVMDGWWAEAYNGRNGWSIGTDGAYKDEHTQDEADAASFYRTLEHEVIPLFFDRDADGIPHGWIQVMKESIRSCAPAFSFRRMLIDYWDELYLPAIEAGARHHRQGFESAVQLASWMHFMRIHWPHVAIRSLHVSPADVTVGQAVQIEARIELGVINPADVRVEAVGYREAVSRATALAMQIELAHADVDSGLAIYRGEWRPEHNGNLGLGVRIRPSHPDLLSLCHTGLVTWADSSTLA